MPSPKGPITQDDYEDWKEALERATREAERQTPPPPPPTKNK